MDEEYGGIRVRLKLNNNDGDILSLLSRYSFPYLLRAAIEFYLGISHERIAVDLTAGYTDTQTVSAMISRKKEPRIYDFLSAIEPEKVPTVVKLLIRHAMDACDLRFATAQSDGASLVTAESRATRRVKRNDNTLSPRQAPRTALRAVEEAKTVTEDVQRTENAAAASDATQRTQREPQSEMDVQPPTVRNAAPNATQSGQNRRKRKRKNSGAKQTSAPSAETTQTINDKPQAERKYPAVEVNLSRPQRPPERNSDSIFDLI